MTPAPSKAPARPLRRNPMLAGGVSVLVLLLLCWPFVRDPPLGLRDTYVHLFGAWVAVILFACWLSRGLGSSATGPERR
jgi:hypothetical protein